MKKESFVAVFLGIFFGTLLSIIIINFTKKTTTTQQKTVAPQETPRPVLSPIKTQSLEIIEPRQNKIFSESVISIKGKAEKNSLLVIQTPQEDKTIKLQNDYFVEPIKLVLGENFIKIVNYQKNNVEEKTLKVYYLK